MMRHKEIEKLIQKKLDREITEDEEIFLLEHLKQCADCNAYYLQLEQIKDEILNLTEFFPKADFNARIFARIHTRRTTLWHKLIPTLISAYFASLLVLLFSPLSRHFSQKVLIAIPSILQISFKIEPVVKGIGLLISSLIKIDLTQLLFGFFLSLFLFYVFIKAIKSNKEEKWAIQKFC
ncbi:MAG: zf-HC2 domain-containing protein [candidate division WOR-3 bacterium]